MTEIIPEQVVDLSNCTHLSPAGADEEHSDARLSDEREERERLHGGQTSGDEYKKRGTEMDSDEYDDYESPTTLGRSESPPESSDRTECNRDDPDVKPTHSYITLIAMAILSSPVHLRYLSILQEQGQELEEQYSTQLVSQRVLHQSGSQRKRQR